MPTANDFQPHALNPQMIVGTAALACPERSRRGCPAAQFHRAAAPRTPPHKPAPQNKSSHPEAGALCPTKDLCNPGRRL